MFRLLSPSIHAYLSPHTHPQAMLSSLRDDSEGEKTVTHIETHRSLCFASLSLCFQHKHPLLKASSTEALWEMNNLAAFPVIGMSDSLFDFLPLELAVMMLHG